MIDFPLFSIFGRKDDGMADDAFTHDASHHDVQTDEEGNVNITPHSFAAADDESCSVCGRFADDHVHDANSIAAHEAASN